MATSKQPQQPNCKTVAKALTHESRALRRDERELTRKQRELKQKQRELIRRRRDLHDKFKAMGIAEPVPADCKTKIATNMNRNSDALAPTSVQQVMEKQKRTRRAQEASNVTHAENLKKRQGRQSHVGRGPIFPTKTYPQRAGFQK